VNDPKDSPTKVEGVGVFEPPPGLTPEDCERLAREADEARKDQ
jgi:hypothetical protein